MSVVERLRRGHGRNDAVVFGHGELVVAPMRKRDLRAGVLDVERASYPTGWSQKIFQTELDQMRAGHRWYVVARPGRGLGADGAPRSVEHTALHGHAGLMFVADEAHVTTVAVRPDQRRGGTASRMLLALADEALRRGAEAWTLEVRASATGAQELYRTFGFAPAGVRLGYYEAPADQADARREDAIVMWCHDIQGAAYRSRLDELWERYR